MTSVFSKLVLSVVVAVMVNASAASQSGGGFEIAEAVIAAGASVASESNISVDLTLGQAASGGALAEPPFAVTSGFWNFTPAAPTAANASISGRVRTVDSIGINDAVLFLQTQSGEIRLARSSSFGYYMFEGIEVGQSVFITVEHKRFTFNPRSIMVIDNVTDLDFVPQP